MSKISKKGNNSKIVKNFVSKISPNTSLIIPIQLAQVSSFYIEYFLRYGIYIISFQFFQRALILQGEIIKKKYTCLLFFHEESIHKVSRQYPIPEYNSCKISGAKILKKGNNSKKYMNFFHFFIKYSIHHSVSADTSFKFLAIILFEIRHLQNFIPLFVKGP